MYDAGLRLMQLRSRVVGRSLFAFSAESIFFLRLGTIHRVAGQSERRVKPLPPSSPQACSKELAGHKDRALDALKIQMK